MVSSFEDVYAMWFGLWYKSVVVVVEQYKVTKTASRVGNRGSYAELWNLTCGMVLELSQPLKETTAVTQVRVKHVTATARHATIMISSLPCLIAATVKSEVLNMNTRPPQARKNPARASVGGLLGNVERGGPNHRKK